MRFKNIRTYFFITLGLTFVVRFFQCFNTVDYVTGFFKPDYKSIGIILVAVNFLAAFSMVAVSFTIRRCPLKLPSINRVGGSFALANALAILLDIGKLPQTFNVPSWQIVLLKVTGALAAVFFGALFVKSIKNYKLPSVCYVAPVLYYLVRLIYSFVSTSTLALISDNIYTLAAEIFVLLFMLQFALVANGMGGDYGYKKIAATGFTAVILCVLSSAPPIITYLTNRSLAVRVNFFSEVVFLTTACFIYCFLRRHFSSRNLKKRRKCRERQSLFIDEDTDNFYMG